MNKKERIRSSVFKTNTKLVIKSEETNKRKEEKMSETNTKDMEWKFKDDRKLSTRI